MKQAVRHWQQRWRMAETRLLLLALIVSVTVVTAVGFFTSRVENAMLAQARQLLGGDLVLTAARPLAADYLSRAEQLGLQTASTISFPSMATVGEQSQLVQLQAVSSHYPLRGDLKAAAAPNAPEQLVTGQLPANGEIWAEARVFAELNVNVGAQLQLGRSTFTLSKVLTQEPDRGTNLFQLAPIVLMNLEDLPPTGLLSPASRANFSQLFAGNSRTIQQFRQALQPDLKATERFRTLEEDVASVQQALQRSGRFLGLAALLSVVLAGAAVVLTANSLMRREWSAVAVLKAMGMSRRQVLRDYLLSLLITAALAAGIGIVLGFGLQFGLAAWLGNVVGQLPAPSLMPILSGALTAVILLLGFALPSLLRLVDTSPMQILQGSWQRPQQTVWFTIAGVLLAMGGLLWLQAQDVKLAGLLLVGLLAGIAIFWTVATVSLRAVQALRQRWQITWLPSLGHSPRAVLLVVVFATGLFALLLLTTVRTDLLNRWEASLPADAPDHFLINIQPQDVAPLQSFLAQQQLQATLYPMVRGRLVEVNGKAVSEEQYPEQRAKRLLEREFNLSATDQLPTSNALVAGQWFAPDAQATGFSIEKGIGETLQFGMGDQLTFDIAGQRLTETVTSVREVRWDSMQPNFFVITTPATLAALPRTFITSVHLGAQKTVVTALVKQFPSITAIDVSAILRQIKTLLEQASRTVQGIFVFTLLAGIVVLIAALQSQKAERKREIAILKAMGARHALLRRRIWGEFLLLGGIAGMLAGVLAGLVGATVGYFLFDLDWHWRLLPIVMGGVAGSLLVGIAGYGNLRGLLTVLPLSLLKS